MIVSSFYLIKGDGKPIYVGFTNRNIRQRFAEHKTDKDFSQFDKVTIEQLDKLEYNFTWDEDVLYKNANDVSVREAQLVEEYGTQDSKYQKASDGGQVWTYEKWFVRTNKDNPKFLGMTSEEVEEYLKESDVVKSYMGNFVNGMQDPVRVYMSSFVNNAKDPVRVHMQNFVNHIEHPVRAYMRNFANGMKDPVRVYMGNFVNGMQDTARVYMKHFVSDMNDPVRIYMKNCVTHMNMKKKEEIK